jgi:cysteinyl-tRNA synthetase
VKIVNSIKDGKESINQANLNRLKQLMNTFVFEILGLKNEQSASNNKTIDSVMNLVLDIRENARKNKDWTTADIIRDGLSKSGIIVKDAKDGSSWSIK